MGGSPAPQPLLCGSCVWNGRGWPREAQERSQFRERRGESRGRRCAASWQSKERINKPNGKGKTVACLQAAGKKRITGKRGRPEARNWEGDVDWLVAPDIFFLLAAGSWIETRCCDRMMGLQQMFTDFLATDAVNFTFTAQLVVSLDSIKVTSRRL